MNKRQLWFDHKFNLGIDIGWTDNVMSRIQDCAIRLEHYTKDKTDDILSKKNADNWSIKEHIGHLIDLEDLWINRFLQFELFVPDLVHADMTNLKTELANHNTMSIQNLLSEFKSERKRLINTFDSLSAKALIHDAFHPRLKVIMKPVDLLFFVAEHDNHHITSIKRMLGKKTK